MARVNLQSLLLTGVKAEEEEFGGISYSYSWKSDVVMSRIVIKLESKFPRVHYAYLASLP